MISRLMSGQRVRLAPLYFDDATTVAQWYEDSVYVRMVDTSMAFPRTVDSIRRWLTSEDNGKLAAFAFAVRPLHDNTLLGFVTVDEIQWHHGTGWISIGFGPSHQDQGYGSEALGLMCDFAFQELNLYRLQLTVFAYNQRAIHVYEKLGWQREGAHREAIHRDGQRWDLLLYGLLRHEWAAQRGE